MPVNRDKPHQWKEDILRSVDMYNSWFIQIAPETFKNIRSQTIKDVEAAFKITKNLTFIDPNILLYYPEILPTLRMATCPPLAVDRLIGLADVPPNMVKRMEAEKALPIRMSQEQQLVELGKIVNIIERMADSDIIVWLNRVEPPTDSELDRAATIIADRLCGSIANPIIRNAQEKRQVGIITDWLEAKGYRLLHKDERGTFRTMPQGTFCFRLAIPVILEDRTKTIHIPIDAVIMPKSAHTGELPLLIEAKSAGDFANVNKRRKEEAIKISQLRRTYGTSIQFILFLCGYFDSGYLGYEAAEGIDWVWEHRIDDLAEFGI